MESATKIVATIGPASNSREIISALISHRMDIVRLNFSWGTHEWHTELIKNIREISKNEWARIGGTDK